MSTYPTRPRTAFLDWCQVHKHIFSAHAAEIGLTTEEAAAFATAAALGESRLFDQESAKEASKVATQQVVDAFDDLTRQAGSVVRTIRAYAESSDDPNAVYAVAQIPPHAEPSPLPPPGQPSNLTVTLDATLGTITLAWKAENPVGASGTAYIVRRRLPGESDFTFLGISGKKAFEDNTLVAGPDSVQYTVQGQRGDLSGPVSPIFTVNFGRLANGLRTASVSTNANGVAMMANGAGMMSGAAGMPNGNGGAWNVEIPAPSGNGRRMATSR